MEDSKETFACADEDNLTPYSEVQLQTKKKFPYLLEVMLTKGKF